VRVTELVLKFAAMKGVCTKLGVGGYVPRMELNALWYTAPWKDAQANV